MIDTVNSPLWESLQQESKAIEKSIPSLERKRTGSYYTDLRLTDVMMKELTSHLLYGEKPIWEYRFLEPCVGTGNFVFSYLKCIYRFGITTEEAKVLLDNIYVADIFEPALEKYKELLSAVAKEYWNIRLDNKYFEKHTGGALLIDVTAEPPEYIPVSGRTDVIEDLKKRSKAAGTVYLATDPDREGEAISWHLKELLDLPDSKARRVTCSGARCAGVCPRDGSSPWPSAWWWTGSGRFGASPRRNTGIWTRTWSARTRPAALQPGTTAKMRKSGSFTARRRSCL